MQKVVLVVTIILLSLCFTPSVFAAPTTPDLAAVTSSTLQTITLIATLAAVVFLIKGGYTYLTSTGKPDALESAKTTIRNALIGLVLVVSANVVVTTFRHALTPDTASTGSTIVNLAPLETVEPSEGLTQVLIDAVSAFMQHIVESATSPVVDGIMHFLTTTPTLVDNSVIRNFWLVSLGIVDSLFVVVVALLGLQLMSAGTLGFEEVELRQLLPRIGLAFLGANVSLALADYVITASNTLVGTVLDATGGLNYAWITNAVNPTALATGTTPLITLIFLILFLIVSIVLLLLYISRLLFISLGAVLFPFIFLLWLIPKFSDLAEISAKSYVVTVFMTFVHVVIIQLAASFLTLPEHSENSLISIVVAIGLFFTLLKVPSLMMQMVFYTSRNGTFKKMGHQIMNVMTTHNASSATRSLATREAVKLPRKVINP